MNKEYPWLPENVTFSDGQTEWLHFDTMDEMIDFNKSLGATHVSMSNYHEGAFWIAELNKPDENGMVRMHLNHFHCGFNDGKYGRNLGWTCGDNFAFGWDRHDLSPGHTYLKGLTQMYFVPIDEMLEQDYTRNACMCNDMDKEYDQDSLIILEREWRIP